jgi:hypothetical protein
MSFSIGVRKFAGLTTAVVLGALALAACGGSPQEAGQGTPAGEASATQETAQATTRAEGSTAGMGGTTMAMSGGPMAGMETTEVPAIEGFYHGEEILFVHTEVSDQEIANQMTANMGSPLLFVPALERVPEAARADVFVFTNGVSGSSGQGFQPDVFDSAPGDPDYSPLRELNLVTWEDEGAARVLGSAAEIEEAAQNGEITIERPGVVFNMPFLTWPGGRR